jgi:L-threonylcarbamoyladenylate synthase
MSDAPSSEPEGWLTAPDASKLSECLAGGGVCLFPSDTVYGLGCDPTSAAAVSRLYELKGRPPERPAAVMFFALQGALAALGELTDRERAAMRALLPGPVTMLLANRGRRYPLACGPNPDTLGLRVPALVGPLAALGEVRVPILQSSANLSGEPDARRLAEVPPQLVKSVDLVLDAGELAGMASTVLDLRDYARNGTWRVVRDGPLSQAQLERALGGP